MEFDLTHTVGGRHTEFPAAVISDIEVRSLRGRPHPRRWEGVIDTGADLSVIPIELSSAPNLGEVRQRVRVWTFRKDEQPREVDVYYVRLGIPSGPEVITKAIVSERQNILIGRAALMKLLLAVDWPAKRWSLDTSSFGTPSP